MVIIIIIIIIIITNNNNKLLMAKIKKYSKLRMPFQKGESSTFS